MKVIKPVVLNDTNVVSSTVAETEYAAYAAGTNYAVGTRAIYQHKIYESVQTPNVGHTPDVSPLYWAVIGPSNRWAMFDGEVSTQTSDAATLTVVIKPGYVNCLALFGLEGSTLDVTIRDGLAGPVVYSNAVAMDGTVIADWYQYFFEPRVQLGEVVLDGLPVYADAHITITITGTGTVKCGAVSVGTAYQLGDTNYGATAWIMDYSRKETTAAGATTLVKRSYSKGASVPLSLPTGQINKVQRVLAELRATPCAWVGVDAPGYEPLIIFGFYRDFSIDIAYPKLCYCNIEIEGLI